MATVMDDNQLEFDLGADEKATTVSLEAPEAENQPQTPPPEPQAREPQSNKDELDAVNDNVQKRIAKLTARMREAERREQAALEYAKGLQNQASTLQQRLAQTDYSRLNEAKARLDSQQASLRQIIRKAKEEGDLDTEIEAQERLAALIQDQRQVAQYLQEQPQPQQQPQQAPQQAYQQPQQAPQQRPPAPDPRAEEWAAENEWFGKDRTMTYAAWGIHQTLIEEEGIDPSSDEYYTVLNQRIRDQFPKYFANEQPTRQQRSAPAVAPATRSSGVNSVRRTVRLSPSQVAIAKKLGVPLEEYAKYVKE
jgi:hypothetical protein